MGGLASYMACCRSYPAGVLGTDEIAACSIVACSPAMDSPDPDDPSHPGSKWIYPAGLEALVELVD